MQFTDCFAASSKSPSSSKLLYPNRIFFFPPRSVVPVFCSGLAALVARQLCLLVQFQPVLNNLPYTLLYFWIEKCLHLSGHRQNPNKKETWPSNEFKPAIIKDLLRSPSRVLTGAAHSLGFFILKVHPYFSSPQQICLWWIWGAPHRTWIKDRSPAWSCSFTTSFAW